MRQTAQFLALLLVPLALPALADPATQAGASRLTDVFQTYLGDTPSVVNVVPEGDSYQATLDLERIAKAFTLPAGATVKLAPVKMALTDLGGGRWHVVQDQPWSMSFSVPGRISSSTTIARLQTDGIFDSALMAFTSARSVIEGSAMVQTRTRPDGSTTRVEMLRPKMVTDMTGSAAAAGGVDTTLDMAGDPMSESFDTTPKEGTPVRITFAMGKTQGHWRINGYRTAGLLRLVGFFATHSSVLTIAASQPQLKAAIAAALPLFQSFSGTGTVDTASVETSKGKATAGPVSFEMAMNGVVKDGRLHEKLAVEGIRLGPGLVPDWAAKLVPEKFSFDATVSGFDLADPARMVLDELDLSAEPPLPNGLDNDLVKALVPGGMVVFKADELAASNKLYEVMAKGEMKVGPDAAPEGQMTVTAKGVEAVSQVLGEAPDVIRQKALFALLGAKGIAKQAPDGTLTWVIGRSPDGGVEVNGMTFGQPK